jgi:hypothetical protein
MLIEDEAGTHVYISSSMSCSLEDVLYLIV